MNAELVPVIRSVSIAASDWECLKDQARMFIASGALQRNIQKPEQAMVIMMRGRELGLPPMTALSSINFFDGNTVLMADLMKAIVLRDCKGARIDTLKFDDKEAVVEMERPGRKPFQYKYTIEMARRAGLTGKNNWKNHTEVMNLHRATAIGCRDMFPDLLLGCYIPDEADEMRDVTPSEQAKRSADFVAERALETDWLPGIEPKQTAKQFVERVKDVDGGTQVIHGAVQGFLDKEDPDSAEKLVRAARELGLPDYQKKFDFEKEDSPTLGVSGK